MVEYDAALSETSELKASLENPVSQPFRAACLLANRAACALRSLSALAEPSIETVSYTHLTLPTKA